MDTSRRRQPRVISDPDRVETIAKMRCRGFTWSQIGATVGLSANGAKYALHKETQPGRYLIHDEEEGELLDDDAEQW